MIKVIACDMDGTLLGTDHKISETNLKAIHRAQEAGIRFMIATGRNFQGAIEELEGLELTCDYLVGSGAEVRTPDRQVIQRCAIPMELCRQVYQALEEFPVSIIFCSDKYDYRFGTPEEIEEGCFQQIQLFHLNMSREEILASDLYQRVKANNRRLLDLGELEEKGIPIYKIFLFSDDIPMLQEINRRLEGREGIAVSSSFITNVEITAAEAQKGPVLKQYIERLGYSMDEVMVLGDSLNDYSMLSMDFGATVAMENGVPEIKAAAKYVTKSNREDGVAYAIDRMLEGDWEALSP
ncbi:MAG TPA: HAD family hydrolase [Candidatus Egerieimonas intestinavium]|uniref:HAD family hydrolase n=1 Tax=Candidatus Egerieimonas intestinavium TaxID=2840777 RepID=A0A9D1JF30_9FIRM|nr:HAD family hydrolase [Candidatus Egerieimonas intestinavium]